MMSSSGMNVSLVISTNRGSTSLGTFTRANTSWSSVRVAQAHDQAQRQVRDVGERPPGADRQRRQHGEDLLAEVTLDLARRARRTPRRRRSGCRARRARGGRTSENWRAWRRSSSRTRSAMPLEHLGGRQPVGTAGVDPRVELVVDAGDADHEELVQVGDEDRQELQPLDQRQRLVLGELEHAVVEVEPRELAVGVQRAVREVAPSRSAPRRRPPSPVADASRCACSVIAHATVSPAARSPQLAGSHEHDQLALLDRRPVRPCASAPERR